MTTPDDQDKSSRRKTQPYQKADESAPDALTRTSDADHPEPANDQQQREARAHRIKIGFQHFISSQATTNWLIAFFTGLLAFLTWMTMQPQVIVQPTPLQHFEKGGKPRELITFNNVGHQPAYALVSGFAIYVFKYPLEHRRLTELPTNSIPLDLYPGGFPTGRSIEFAQPITDFDFAAVSDGTKRLIYVWGTIKYRDFFHIPYQQDFCFAFGGSDVTGPGLCSVERPRYAYGVELEQEPNAQQPNAQPVP